MEWNKEQAKEFKIPNYSKEYLRKPVILHNIGGLNNKKILEIGCGSGYWTRLFAERGANCIGIDISKNQIEIAKQEEKKAPLGIKFLVQDGSDLKNFKDKSFDIIFIEFVFCEIKSKKLISKIIQESHRVLKENGFLFISDRHPFDPFFDKRLGLPKNFHYFKTGAKVVAHGKKLNGEIMEFVDYHWTLEDFFSSLTENNFVISKLIEPKVDHEMILKNPYLKYRENLPKNIIVIGRKI